jgi:hypothetical protein
MGLSFHYNGRIADPALLPELIDEVRDIAIVHKWDFFVFDKQFTEEGFDKPFHKQNVYGICFTPPGCETVDICFLSNGKMSSITNLQFWGESTDPTEKTYLYMNSVKTQFASVELHQILIHLFRYLSQKYFADFNLHDEGSYWETNDVVLLTANFNRNLALINSFESALETIPKNSGEDVETYLERILKVIHDKKNEIRDSLGNLN